MSKALEIEHKSFLDAFRCQKLLLLCGRQPHGPDVLAYRNVEHLALIEHVGGNGLAQHHSTPRSIQAIAHLSQGCPSNASPLALSTL